MNIHIGKLTHKVTEQDLRSLFEPFGTVEEVQVIVNIWTGEPQGYGFVVMPSDEEANNAITSLNGSALMGEAVTVEKAKRQNGNKRSRGFRNDKKNRPKRFSEHPSDSSSRDDAPPI